MPKTISLARRATGAILAALLLCLLGIVGVMQLGERTGHPVFVIRGHSMEPGVPFGALVVDDAVAPEAIVPGDVITIRAENGVVFTHRVVSVIPTADGLTFQTRGDANGTADPVPMPAAAVIGRTSFYIPFAGILAGLLSMPSGMLSLLSMLAALLLLLWLLEDLEREASLWAAAVRPAVAPWMVRQ
jgi:signal peptidase